VDQNAKLPQVNTATVTTALADPGDPGAQNEQDTTNNTATATTSIGSQGFDLAITSVTDNPDPVNPGSGLTYTVAAVNGGSNAANGVHVKIDLPPSGVAFVGADGTNGFSCTGPTSNSLDCSGDMPAGGSTVITVKLTATLSPPGSLTLTATIDPTNAFAEDDETNNSKSETTTVSGAVCSPGCVDLVAAQMFATPEPVHAGGTLTVKFTVVNVGDTSKAITPGAELMLFDLNGDVSSATPTSSNANFACTIVSFVPGVHLHSDCTKASGKSGELGPGEGVTFTYVVTANSTGTITARGEADPSNALPEFDENNNIAIRVINVVP
jgi:uncharacterized repeat protein (TIGR01451 family)